MKDKETFSRVRMMNKKTKEKIKIKNQNNKSYQRRVAKLKEKVEKNRRNQQSKSLNVRINERMLFHICYFYHINNIIYIFYFLISSFP